MNGGRTSCVARSVRPGLEERRRDRKFELGGERRERREVRMVELDRERSQVLRRRRLTQVVADAPHLGEHREIGARGGCLSTGLQPEREIRVAVTTRGLELEQRDRERHRARIRPAPGSVLVVTRAAVVGS
jgi:hypothetical protein